MDSKPTSQVGIYTINVRYTDGNLVSAYMTFTIDVTDTTPWFKSDIFSVFRSYNSAPYSMPLSSYFSDPTGETLTMTGTYTLGTNAPMTIPGSIFTQPSSYTIVITPTSAS